VNVQKFVRTADPKEFKTLETRLNQAREIMNGLVASDIKENRNTVKPIAEDIESYAKLTVNLRDYVLAYTKTLETVIDVNGPRAIELIGTLMKTAENSSDPKNYCWQRAANIAEYSQRPRFRKRSTVWR